MSLVVLVLLAGCDIETVTLSPEIDGTLTINGTLAGNAEVFFGFSGDDDHPCPAVPADRTDTKGRFHLSATTARDSAKTIKSRRYSTTPNYMCFKYQGELMVGDLMLTELNETRKYIAECRLPVPPNAVAEDTLVCRWRTTNDS